MLLFILPWQMDSYLLYQRGSPISLCLKALKQILVMQPYVKPIFVPLNAWHVLTGDFLLQLCWEEPPGRGLKLETQEGAWGR